MSFWQIIDACSSEPFNVAESSSRLEMALKEMPESEVLAFCSEFEQKMDGAYTWELWGVAYLINGGCGDDSFMDFRGSLIACGQSIYEAAVADAESLMVLDKKHLSEMFEEGFIYSGSNAYQSLTGKAPVRSIVGKESPSGNEWEETRQSLQQHFPRAWDIYGWDEPPEPEPDPSEPKRPWWKLW